MLLESKSWSKNNPVARILSGSVCYSKRQICGSFMFFFVFFCVLQLYFPFFRGIRKITYFSFGLSCWKCTFFSTMVLFFFSQIPHKISGCLLLHTAGISPKLSLMISTYAVITNVKNTVLNCGHWLASLLTCNTTITFTYQYKSLVINM